MYLECGKRGLSTMLSPRLRPNSCGLLSFFCTIMQYLKLAMDQYERDLLSVVNSLLLSIQESDLRHTMSSPCNDSCIRFSLVKLLRLSGYDAGVCAAKWPGSNKVPGGDHEYIDVVSHNDTGSPERLIIDIDFHSHFQIARAVESYDRILASLPVVYVGSWNKMNQFLQVMVEAARASLKQNSMPFPPWRSLAYLQAKWQSPYQRKLSPDEQSFSGTNSFEHNQCGGHLKRLQSEIEIKRMLKPVNNSWRPKLDRLRQSSYRTL
ncbi:OLC1v1027629C2 [Oldenlandia corymbosa var. corymbosa]|uniref:OLC1v1027629C2 n=1 Tax=Oldenlandia corymbosa var. corymbosa TaxID=529605 RepID=A0AAV1CA64_OLDCO|nr:OLC1v1027629C2 [Oldenlandia corymbosa var. corymbosa]